MNYGIQPAEDEWMNLGGHMKSRRNYRSYLLQGIRERIAKEPFGLRLLGLYSMLFDAVELPC